ncbi:synapse differentiation-inducing gene protein 1-like [Pelobates fuscus]|uniref:synapse differentiation-inducing gene protein 1-like n=1 Tax=Pelobates fuscus TaxID=191477 RepID=UPI002FE471A7
MSMETLGILMLLQPVEDREQTPGAQTPSWSQSIQGILAHYSTTTKKGTREEENMPEERGNQGLGFAQSEQRTSDYLWWSIMNLVCCCLPLGIAAIIYSRKTRDAVLTHDMDSAARYSHKTLILNISALVIGIILNIIVLCVYFKVINIY